MGATWAKDFARHNTCVAAIAPGGGLLHGHGEGDAQ